MKLTRRTVISGVCAAAAHTLFSARLRAAMLHTGDEQSAAPPGTLELELAQVTPNTLRISIAPANDPLHRSELGFVEQQQEKVLSAQALAAEKNIAWGKYEIRVTAAPLRIAVFQGGKLRQQIEFEPDSSSVVFPLDGPIHGLGEGGKPFDRRGTSDELVNGEHSRDLQTWGARVRIPWIFSPTGWGIFVGQPHGTFRFTDKQGRLYGTEATSTRNVFLCLGDAPIDLLAEYAHLTGQPHLPARWTFGYQQSHRTLASTEEIVSIAQTFRDKKLPCDALIYLGTGFCPSGWNSGHGSFTFNKQVFPDPPATLKQLHDRNMKVIVHMVPPGDFHGTVNDTPAETAQPGDAAVYWARHLPLLQAGVDGWWPDEGDELSVYARLHRNRMYWEGSLQHNPRMRPFALHRNGYAGLQRYGWLWSGDTLSTWAALRAQIAVGINAGLSGLPHWGTDTGGFVPTPEYGPELFVRWFQFSAFCPSFRSHGRAWKLHLPWGWNTGESGPKEVEGEWVAQWPPAEDLHRPDVEAICRKFLNLRYQLLPYIYSSAEETSRTGAPLIRAMCLGFPNDSQARTIDDTYLWGASMLVAPVATKGSSQRPTYLPAGAWWDFWTNKRLDGGSIVQHATSLETMPLFVKAGAILPLDPLRQHSQQAVTEPTTLLIYPGADGAFDWYDDDGSSFEYQNGAFMRLHCTWDDHGQTLHLQLDRQGNLGAGREVLIGTANSQQRKKVTLAYEKTSHKL